MTTRMGMHVPGTRPGLTWVTRITYASGRTEDVENTAGPDGQVTVIVPPDATVAGPSWVKGETPEPLPPGTWDEQMRHALAAPVTYVLTGGGDASGCITSEGSGGASGGNAQPHTWGGGGGGSAPGGLVARHHSHEYPGPCPEGCPAREIIIPHGDSESWYAVDTYRPRTGTG